MRVVYPCPLAAVAEGAHLLDGDVGVVPLHDGEEGEHLGRAGGQGRPATFPKKTVQNPSRLAWRLWCRAVHAQTNRARKLAKRISRVSLPFGDGIQPTTAVGGDEVMAREACW